MKYSPFVLVSAFALGLFGSSCAFFDQRVPCANAGECGDGTCGVDGFCDTIDLGDSGAIQRDGGAPEPEFDAGSPEFDAGTTEVDAGFGPEDAGSETEDAGSETEDAGSESDAGAFLDAGASDGGSSVDDAGAASDAGAEASDSGSPFDAGDEPDAGVVVDAGPLDAGVPFDAGAPDAGAPDAGAPDAGAPDAGVCVSGSQTDPDNCGACGFVCGSSVCAAGICGPELVIDHPAEILEIFLDNGDVYYVDDEGNLFRGEFGAPSALLETSLDIVNLEGANGRVIASAGPGGGGYAYRVGSLPLPTLNSMDAAPFAAGSFRGASDRGFGLAIRNNFAAIGYEDGLAVVNLTTGTPALVGFAPRNAPIFVEDDVILSVDNSGTVFATGTGASPGDQAVAVLGCPGGGSARVTAADETLLRVTFAASCGAGGVGFFTMGPEQTGTVNNFFVLAAAPQNAKALSVSRVLSGAIVGLAFSSGYELRYSNSPGTSREWLAGGATLVDVETDSTYVYFAETLGGNSRISRFEIPPP